MYAISFVMGIGSLVAETKQLVSGHLRNFPLLVYRASGFEMTPFGPPEQCSAMTLFEYQKARPELLVIANNRPVKTVTFL